MFLLLFLTFLADSTYIHLSGRPNQALVIVNENLTSPIHITTGDSLLLPIGENTLRFIHPAYADMLVRVQMNSGESKQMVYDLMQFRAPIPNVRSTWYALKNRSTVYVVTDAETAILHEGVEVGRGTANIDVPFGTRGEDIELRMGSRSTHIPIDLSRNRTQSIRHYLKPKLGTYLLLSPIPGLTQVYEKRYIVATGLVGAIAYAAHAYDGAANRYNKRHEDYLDARFRYEQANTFDEAERLGIEMEASYKRIKPALDKKNQFAWMLGAALSLHVIDIAIPPKYGFRKVTIGTNPYGVIGTDIRISF